MRVKMSKQLPPAPTASAVGPCPTIIKGVGRPVTGSLPSTIAPPDHPKKSVQSKRKCFTEKGSWQGIHRGQSSPFGKKDWLVGCFGFNGPLRQYFSLYRAVSQKDGEREEKS